MPTTPGEFPPSTGHGTTAPPGGWNGATGTRADGSWDRGLIAAERARIARELHDPVDKGLHGIALAAASPATSPTTSLAAQRGPADPGDLQPAARYGLVGMTGRARKPGGTLVIRSRPGHGTLIAVQVPGPATEPAR